MNENQSHPAASTAQPQASHAAKGGPWILFPVLLVLILLVFGVAYWMISSQSGQQFLDSLGSGQQKEAEKKAAAALNKSGVVAIAEPPDQKVTSVNFAGQAATDETLADVSKLYRVITVNLENAKIADSQLHYITGLRNVTILVLTNTPVTDDGAKQLTAMKVEHLYLNGTKLTDDGLEYVGKIPSLKFLNISNTKVTDKGMRHLAGLKKLEWLVISDTGITDAGLDELASFENLHRLTTRNTKVTPEGIDRLKAKLPKLAVE